MKQPLTLESKIKELYAAPIGHDALNKVFMQLGIRDTFLTHGFISNLKLKTVAKLTQKQLGNDFFDALLQSG